MPRGQKICPQCQTACGPRSHTCKNCGYDFKASMNSKPATPKKEKAPKEEAKEQPAKKEEPTQEEPKEQATQKKPIIRRQPKPGMTKVEEKDKDFRPQSLDPTKSIIVTPTGPPPAAPGPEYFTVVRNWVVDVVKKAEEQGWQLTADAVIYWARYYWPISEDVFKKVMAEIYKLMGLTDTDEEVNTDEPVTEEVLNTNYDDLNEDDIEDEELSDVETPEEQEVI